MAEAFVVAGLGGIGWALASSGQLDFLRFMLLAIVGGLAMAPFHRR